VSEEPWQHVLVQHEMPEEHQDLLVTLRRSVSCQNIITSKHARKSTIRIQWEIQNITIHNDLRQLHYNSVCVVSDG